MKDIKCECSKKELCIKMRNNSLKDAISKLKLNLDKSNGYIVISILISIIHLLETYDCIPCEILLKRVKWVKESNEDSSNDSACEMRLKLLVSELETFLDSEENN